MLYENWLHHGSLEISTPYCAPLNKNISCDVLVIGAGMAGLQAALRLVEAGKDVVLLEKRICGGSSSGKSAGFLTPESEEDINQLIGKYGKEKAKKIYQIPSQGVNMIIENIKKFKLKCDFRKQDSLYLSIKKSHNKSIEEEMEIRKEMKLPYELLDEKALQKIHPGKGYTLGLKSGGTYGFNSFAYCQGMKNVLLKKGVRIFEDSEVKKIENNTAITHLGSVKANNIIVCMDKIKSEFDKDISKDYYHIQTYIAISEPLSEEEVKAVFPKEELMCWDTRWDYMHYRLVEGNRILVGGSSPWTAYAPEYYYSPKIIEFFIKDLKWRFPDLKDVHFTHYWSGLIDVTKDLVPVADYDPKNKKIQYAFGCAGLNWATYCGDYLARRVLDKNTEDLSEFLGINRKYFIGKRVQSVLGKRISFAISHIRELLK